MTIQIIGKKREIPIEIDDHFKLFGKNHGKLNMVKNVQYVMLE